jgi:hypothetical protein
VQSTAVSEEKLTTSGAMLLAEAARTGFGQFGYNVLLISAFVAEAMLQRFHGRRILPKGEWDESPA